MNKKLILILSLVTSNIFSMEFKEGLYILPVSHSEMKKIADAWSADQDRKGCGICKQRDTETEKAWFSNQSNFVHESCFNSIVALEKEIKLYKTLQNLYSEKNQQNDAHREIIAELEKKILNDKITSIKSYLDTHGAIEFKKNLEQAFSNFLNKQTTNTNRSLERK